MSETEEGQGVKDTKSLIHSFQWVILIWSKVSQMSTWRTVLLLIILVRHLTNFIWPH